MNTIKELEHAFTSKYWAWTYLESSQGPRTLLQSLHKELSHIPQTSWPERFLLGGVYVNGLPVTGEMELPRPCKVEYYEPKFELQEAAEYYPKFSEELILYQDADMSAS